MSDTGMNYGLIGYPLSHSFSKTYFETKFRELGLDKACYLNFDIPSLDHLRQIITEHDLRGFNVTIPYKETILPLLDAIDPVAKAIGAVNCVKVADHNGHFHLTGYNTDHYGFAQSIKPFLEPVHERALILGTGGSSKAVAYALKQVGVDVYFVTREKKQEGPYFTYDELNEYILQAFKLIVNTTPLGLFPNVSEYPAIPYEHIGPQHLCYDLIYNPEETLFLKKGKEKGATVVSGLNMLRLQADKSWELWYTL